MIHTNMPPVSVSLSLIQAKSCALAVLNTYNICSKDFPIASQHYPPSHIHTKLVQTVEVFHATKVGIHHISLKNLCQVKAG